MSASNLDTDNSKEELRVRQQIAFASGLFQADITIRTVLESLAEGVVIIDSSGTIVLVNEYAGQLFGYPEKGLIGRPHAVLVPECLREVHEKHMARFFSEPQIRPMGVLLDLVGCRQDGSEFPLEISLSFLETINGVLVLAFVGDITLRKQMETRLRKSEELFRIQVESVKDYAIFTLDAQGNVLNWNAGAERLTGYRAEEVIGKHVSCFYTEKDRAAGAPDAELKKAAEKGQFAGEGWRIRKDGSRFWADIVFTALHDESGNLWAFSTVTHDITERKNTEEALSFSEARYRALFRDNPTMVFTLDSQGTILTANPSAASQLGYTMDELERQPVLNLFHQDDRAALLKQLQTCLNNPNEVHRWQFRKIRKDGKLLWVEEVAQAVNGLDGALTVLVVCQDVTERKIAEEALRKSEMKLSKIFHSVPVLIGITTVAQGRCIDMNEKGLQILGYRREEVIGRSTLELGIWESESAREQATRILTEEGMVRDLEVHLRGKSGKPFTGTLSAELIDFDGEQYMLSVINDITERKRMEEEIVRLNDDLEAFNFTVAHDLRQPLNVIGSYCQMIERLCGDQLGDECRGFVQGAYDTTLRMDHLIGALLNFSRLARVEPRREAVDLSALAHEVADGLRQTELGRQVSFEIADGVMANGDASLLRAVLGNLLSNAWKYTGMREQAIIEFGVEEIDGVPTYFVRDNGAGFDMGDADKLFTPFERLPETEKQRGFGIGLSTVKRIIGRHDGRVWAEGRPGKGACFYFTLAPK